MNMLTVGWSRTTRNRTVYTETTTLSVNQYHQQLSESLDRNLGDSLTLTVCCKCTLELSILS